MKHRFLPFIILVPLWIFATLPLLQQGFIPTHDGEYHLIRFYEFATMLKAGYWFPRWAPGLNSGYGVPLFNFFYPFPNYAGSLFHFLGASLSDSFKLVLFTGYITAGTACFVWLKKIFDERSALIGTIVFSFVPYWFVDIYVRGSVGEVLAISFAMIVLAAVEYNKSVLVAVGIAGLILSHNILAMIFAPFLLTYILLRNKQIIWYYFAGFLLSSYFWVPALLERQYVTGLNTVNFRDHFPDLTQMIFPSWGTNFSQAGAPYDEMSAQIGIVPLLVFVIALIKSRRAGSTLGAGMRRLLYWFLGVAVISMLLILPGSEKIWGILRPLQLLQYPWRLLSFIIPIAGFASAYLAYKMKRIWVFVVLAIFAVLVTSQYIRPNVYEARNDAHYLTRREFTDGTSSLGNGFSTIWTPWIETRSNTKISVIGKEGIVRELHIKPTDYLFNIESTKGAVVRVHSLYYPGWKAVVDGKPVHVENKDGLIQLPVSTGMHTIRVYFGETSLRTIADAVSLLSLFWLCTHGILVSIYARRH